MIIIIFALFGFLVPKEKTSKYAVSKEDRMVFAVRIPNATYELFSIFEFEERTSQNRIGAFLLFIFQPPHVIFQNNFKSDVLCHLSMF